MKKTIFFLLFFLFTSFLFCYELNLASEGETNYIASNWLIYLNKIPFENKLGNYEIKYIEQINYNQNPLCRVYHLSPSGHILIPFYKEFPPIKSFSLISDFDTESKGYEFVVLEELKIGFTFLESYELGKSEEINKAIKRTFNQWNKILKIDFREFYWNEIKLPERGKKNVYSLVLRDKFGNKLKTIRAPPLLKTKWNQTSPYWNWCPTLRGSKCYVGCVATAMAQIMRYYKYPKQGEGSHSYYWNKGNKWLYANFSDSYDWEYMPYTTSQYNTSREKDAVAELCYEAGVSIDMHYSPEGSGAWLLDVAEALKKYFKYSNAVKYVWRQEYNDVNEWFNVFKEQRDLLRPVEFGIDSKDGGHAVVADGYLITDRLNQVHINMGWGGYCDAYYTLDNILDYIITDWQDAVINITPSSQYELVIIAGNGGTTNPAPGTYSYTEGTKVTIKAIPNVYYVFKNWSGSISGKTNPVTVTMDSDKSIKAIFKLIRPPSNFTAQKVLNRSLLLGEYINILKWEANPKNENINIVKYRIYRKKENKLSLLVELNSNKFEYWDRNVEKDKKYRYAIAAVTNEGREGRPAYVTVQ